jgi:hypothetical protein
MKNPSKIPKVFGVEVPETDMVPAPHSDPDEMSTPSPPSSPTRKPSTVHNIIIHIEEVVDHGAIISDIPSQYYDNVQNKKRTHHFVTWNGYVDGARPPADRKGGHCYGWPAENGIAGGEEE